MLLIYNNKAIVSVGISIALTYVIYEFVINKLWPGAEWMPAAMWLVFGGSCTVIDWLIKLRSKTESKAGGGGTVFFIPVWFFGILIMGLGVFQYMNPDEFAKNKPEIPKVDMPDLDKKELPSGPVTSEKPKSE